MCIAEKLTESQPDFLIACTSCRAIMASVGIGLAFNQLQPQSVIRVFSCGLRHLWAAASPKGANLNSRSVRRACPTNLRIAQYRKGTPPKGTPIGRNTTAGLKHRYSPSSRTHGPARILFRRFVVFRPPRLRLLVEAPFGDSVRRMGAGFDGIVPLCRKGLLSLNRVWATASPEGANLNSRRRVGLARRTYGPSNTERNAPEGDAHR